MHSHQKQHRVIGEGAVLENSSIEILGKGIGRILSISENQVFCLIHC